MSYKVNIVANEFVIAGFIPTVESDTALDAQSARSAIRLAGTPTRVKLGLRRKTCHPYGSTRCGFAPT